MKKLYRLVLLMATVCATSFSAAGDEHFSSDGISHDFEVDGIFYNITDEVGLTVEVTYKGDNIYEYEGEYSGDVVIPETVTYSGVTYTVTGIGCRAFSASGAVTSLFIPKTVTEIEMPILSYYAGLTSIVVDDENPVYDSRENCNAIIKTSNGKLVVGCKTTVIPNTVKSIGRYAFHACIELESIEIPNSVAEVYESAFYSCWKLTAVDIPDSVVRIGESVFEDCTNLSSVGLGSHVMYIGNRAFFGLEKLESVVIPDSVIEIGKEAFCKCNLWLVEFGCSVKVIGKNAFGQNNLTSVVIPNSVTEIGAGAFSACPLEEIVLGGSLVDIGRDAFLYGRGENKRLMVLTSLNPTPPNCVTSFNAPACQLNVPAGAKEAYASAKVWKDFTNIVEIATVEVSTQESVATFNIPTTEGAAAYVVDVYSDEELTQLVATVSYDAAGAIVPMSTSLELSIDVLDAGVYYYVVTAKSDTGEELCNYSGAFEVTVSGVEHVDGGKSTVESARYDEYGRLLCKPEKGINIVVYSDGTVRKVFVR